LGFASYLYSIDGYEDSFLSTGYPPAHPNKPSTAPPGSTSATPQPGYPPTN
jgi:hypothetical protein